MKNRLHGMPGERMLSFRSSATRIGTTPNSSHDISPRLRIDYSFTTALLDKAHTHTHSLTSDLLFRASAL